MKPYFTKYIPVMTKMQIGADVPVQHLFLCSRDIQVGDKVKYQYHFEGQARYADGIVKSIPEKHEDYVTYHLDIEGVDTPSLGIGTFKVIGEVSPNAIWVKEGMEFEEEDVDIFSILYIKFKCPTCNTFH